MSILAAGFSFASTPGFLTPHVAALLSHPAILAATTMPADDADAVSALQWLVMAGGVAVALVVAMATGVFRPSRIDGPLRQPAGAPLWPLVVVIGMAVVVWMGSNIFYVAIKQAIAMPQPGLAASRPVLHTTIFDYAVLSTVPGLLAFGWLFFADRRLARISHLQLGFTRDRFLDGVAKGLLASVMIMPVMFLAMVLMQLLYEKLHYTHPAEHELLRLMNEAQSPLLRWWLIGGATITAPFFEEYLFRGFLQTYLRQTFVSWTMKLRPILTPTQVNPASPPPALPPVELPPPGAAPVYIVGYQEPTTETLPPPQGKRVWQTWAAILVTSLLFASIHEAWTAPLIFLLAIFLGYAYERTGSLWTTITIHLVFNATSTAIYLIQSSPHGG